MNVAVLGPGGVGGLVGGALARAGAPAHTRASLTLVGRESTVRHIAERGLRVKSTMLGEFTVRPRALPAISEPVDALIVATKSIGLPEALERIQTQPPLVLPLLNGLDHLGVLRARFGEQEVVAGTIRVESDRPVPGEIVHTSRFLRIDMASRHRSTHPPMGVLAQLLSDAGIPARVHPDASPQGEAQVMWSKLVRLNALACTTSAYDLPLGDIRSTPRLRAELVGAIEEGCAVARAEGAVLDAGEPLGELNAAHDSLGSSMQRDIAAGRTPELDAIPGAVLRAGERHGIDCPTIRGLVERICARGPYRDLLSGYRHHHLAL